MIPENELKRMTNVVYSIPELRGARVYFYGNRQCSVLHKGISGSPNYHLIIILEETQRARHRITGSYSAPKPVITEEVRLNESYLYPELVSSGLNCGLTAVAAGGLAVATVFTGGVALVVTVFLWTGLVTQAYQCGNALGRLGIAHFDPYSTSLQKLDSETWYRNAMTVVDALGLISGIASFAVAAPKIYTLLHLYGKLPSSRLLQGMTKAQRVMEYGKAFRLIGKNPQHKLEFERLVKELGGRIANRFLRSNPTIINRSAQKVSAHVAAKLGSALAGQRDLLIGMTANALPEKYVGSASGLLNTGITAIVDEENDEEEGGIIIHILSD